MPYACRIVADSVSEAGKRITTFEVTYPRSVHSELLTHKMLSKNSASSRAIPVHKIERQILDDPAMPVYWGSAKSGMQAGAELPPDVIARARACILEGRDYMAKLARDLVDLGMHKQDANRYQEPWMFITVLVTATEWDNFFKLRCHPAAHPSLRKIADMMRDARDASTPRDVESGDWHAPFWSADGDIDLEENRDSLLICAARCARVSYLTHNGERDPAKDLELARGLAANGHWSPFEHIAQAASSATRSGNFIGWRQLREDLDPDFIVVPTALLQEQVEVLQELARAHEKEWNALRDLTRDLARYVQGHGHEDDRVALLKRAESLL